MPNRSSSTQQSTTTSKMVEDEEETPEWGRRNTIQEASGNHDHSIRLTSSMPSRRTPDFNDSSTLSQSGTLVNSTLT
jgi:hypothetical protein